jgi:asparagine synthase (glutamine-hydrolysing)
MQEFSGFASLGTEGADPALIARMRAITAATGGAFWADDHAGLTELPGRRMPGQRLAPDVRGTVTLLSGCLFEREATARVLGHPPDTPDALVAADWIRRHGWDRLVDLPGDFALAQWDPAERRLRLAVAPMARRLVYWHRGAEGISFATRIASLHRNSLAPRELDELQLTVRLCARLGDPEHTIYRNIHLLPPGRMLVADGSGLRRSILWEPDLDRRLVLGSDDAYVERARVLLDRAVARRMGSARSPAFLISGGLDSAALIASAARVGGGRALHGHTVVPSTAHPFMSVRERYSSEREKVTALAARHPSLVPHFHASDAPAAMEADPTRLFLSSGLPCMTAGHLGWFEPAFRQVAADGHDALLTGDMGNATLSFGGLPYLGDLLRQGQLVMLARLLPRVTAYRGRRPWDVIKHHMLMPIVPPRLADRIRRRRHGRHPLTTHAAIRSEWLDRIGIDEYLYSHEESATLGTATDTRRHLAHVLINRRIRELENGAMMEAAHGLELRDAFADREIVEFCLAIPGEQFIRDGRERSLIRRLLAGQAPACIVEERRLGDQNPEWAVRLTMQAEALAADLDSFDRHPMLAGMLDIPRLRGLLARLPRDGAPSYAEATAFHVTLARAIHMGRFIRWATGANR